MTGHLTKFPEAIFLYQIHYIHNKIYDYFCQEELYTLFLMRCNVIVQLET